LPAAHPEQRIARITLLEQHLAGREMVGVAKVGQPLQLVGAEVREHRLHFQNDRNFGPFAHFQCLRAPVWADKIVAAANCAISHITFAAPRIDFEAF